VKYSDDPLVDGCDPARAMCMTRFFACVVAFGSAPAAREVASTAQPPVTARMCLRVIIVASSAFPMMAI